MRSTCIILIATFAATGALWAGGQPTASAAVAPKPVEEAPKASSPRRVTVKPSPQLAISENNYPVAVYGYSSRTSSDSVPPVVIQFGAKDASAIDAMEEDLAVMTHIIDRAVDRVGEEVPDALGVPLVYTSGGRSVRALYLDGFGPLIMVKVNFPVHSPATTEAKTPDKQESSEWEDARLHLYGGNREISVRGSSSAVPYDAGRVEALKKQLITALKNASNMKGVKPDESVSVTVFGSPAAVAGGDAFGAGVGRGGGTRPGNSLPGGGKGGDVVYERQGASANLELARTTLQGTVLTLRAKKSDIDAASKGSLDEEAFTKKVTVSTYAGNGYGLKSVNSWVRSSSSSSYQNAR
jgi:hypothetical protein